MASECQAFASLRVPAGGSAGCGLTRRALAIPAVLLFFAAGYYYVSFARLIDARLHGERRARPSARVRPAARAAARPVADRAAARRPAERPRLRAARRCPRSRASSSIGSGDVDDHAARRRSSRARSSASCFQRPTPPGASAAANGAAPPPPPPADRVLRARAAARRPTRAPDARRAGAHRAHQRRAREAAAGGARGHSAARCRRRCWRSRIAASTSIPASIRSASPARSSRTPTGRRAVLAGGQHHHAAGGAQRVPAEVRGHDAEERARAVAQAQAARAVSGRVVLTTPRARRTRSSRCT